MPQDSVALTSGERFDLIDVNALQSLVYQYIREALGPLIGGGFSGLLSPAVPTYTDDGTTYLMHLDPFTCIHIVGTKQSAQPATFASPAKQKNHAWDGIAYTFDPADTGHTNYPVDYTAARVSASAAGWAEYPFVWIRLLDVPSASDTRRFWDVGTQTEVPAPTTTRTYQRLEFAVAVLEPVGGYVRIAQVRNWNAGAADPILTGVSAWDNSDLFTWTGESGDVYDPDNLEGSNFSWILNRLTSASSGTDINAGVITGYADGERTGGLGAHLHWIRRQLRRVIEQGTNDPVGAPTGNWVREPRLSLHGAETRLDTTDAAVAQNTTDVASNAIVAANLLYRTQQQEQRQYVLASGVIMFTPAGLYGGVGPEWRALHGWNLGGCTIGGTHSEVSVEVLLPPAQVLTHYVSSIQVSPVYSAGHFVATLKDSALLPKYLPAAGADPSAFAGPSTLAAYVGPAVGLPAAKYGAALTLVRAGVAVPDIDMTDQIAFSVTVHMSAFKNGDVGI